MKKKKRRIKKSVLFCFVIVAFICASVIVGAIVFKDKLNNNSKDKKVIVEQKLDEIEKHYEMSVIAVGDSFNDITMIKYAGLGAAMMNGRDEVKAVSDIVVPSNEEDGVAWLIEKYLL